MVRVVVIGEKKLEDVALVPADDLASFKAKVRDKTGLAHHVEFDLHGAPVGDSDWLHGVDAALCALYAGPYDAATSPLVTEQSKIQNSDELHARVDPSRDNVETQILVVIKNSEAPATTVTTTTAIPEDLRAADHGSLAFVLISVAVALGVVASPWLSAEAVSGLLYLAMSSVVFVVFVLWCN